MNTIQEYSAKVEITIALDEILKRIRRIEDKIDQIYKFVFVEIDLADKEKEYIGWK